MQNLCYCSVRLQPWCWGQEESRLTEGRRLKIRQAEGQSFFVAEKTLVASLSDKLIRLTEGRNSGSFILGMCTEILFGFQFIHSQGSHTSQKESIRSIAVREGKPALFYKPLHFSLTEQTHGIIVMNFGSVSWLASRGKCFWPTLHCWEAGVNSFSLFGNVPLLLKEFTAGKFNLGSRCKREFRALCWTYPY